MNLIEISGYGLLIAFILYNLAFISYVVALAGKRWKNRDPKVHVAKWGQYGFILSLLGFAGHVVYLISRWIHSGHIPVSNMFEFMTFLGMMMMFAYIVVHLIYRTPILGAFAAPVVVVILAYAAVFPSEAQPLIPALKSYWLYIHVTTAATGEAFLAVGFVAGLMYLLRTVDFKNISKKARRARTGIELTLFTVLLIIGFIAMSFIFKGMDYQAAFTQDIVSVSSDGTEVTRVETVDYTFPPIVKPYASNVQQMESYLGIDSPLFAAPSWMNGVNAGRKLNTVIWSILGGLLLYWFVRLIVRKPLGAAIQPMLDGIDPDDLDEISYRAIAIGYPIFTLGALIFAMIWAAEAWGRFWAFDPKETWALITWLFYTWYLHLRLAKGWQGSKSSWLSVIGFIIIMFTLVGVNLVIAGLHSYAGV